jgi:hypothetical protein
MPCDAQASTLKERENREVSATAGRTAVPSHRSIHALVHKHRHGAHAHASAHKEDGCASGQRTYCGLGRFAGSLCQHANIIS